MKGRPVFYSIDELAWIEAHKEMSRADLTAAFRATFGRVDIEIDNIKALCTRKGWRTGRNGCFPKGNVPVNKGKPMPFNANSAATRFKKGQMSGRAQKRYKPIGTERLSKEGYVERKIHDRQPIQSRWRAVHLIRWEEINGPLPAGMILKCLDSNKGNTDPSNWIPLSRAMLPRLAGRHTLGYDQAPAELKPTILAVAKLEQRAREIRKQDL